MLGRAIGIRRARGKGRVGCGLYLALASSGFECGRCGGVEARTYVLLPSWVVIARPAQRSHSALGTGGRRGVGGRWIMDLQASASKAGPGINSIDRQADRRTDRGKGYF